MLYVHCVNGYAWTLEIPSDVSLNSEVKTEYKSPSYTGDPLPISLSNTIISHSSAVAQQHIRCCANLNEPIRILHGGF